MSEPITDTSRGLRRLLHFLQMSSLELEGFEMDDRLKPEFRKRCKMYRTKFVEWVARDIRTDMRDSKAAMEVLEELTSEKAKDLQLLLDFVIQFDNIADIHKELSAALMSN